MTEGIPARSSTALLSREEAIPSLKYSPKNREIEREKGIEIRRAKKEVRSVPARKGRAPNKLNTGSQILLKKNPNPKALIEGREFTRRERKIAPRRTTMERAEM
jgi:hypothetical protein